MFFTHLFACPARRFASCRQSCVTQVILSEFLHQRQRWRHKHRAIARATCFQMFSFARAARSRPKQRKIAKLDVKMKCTYNSQCFLINVYFNTSSYKSGCNVFATSVQHLLADRHAIQHGDDRAWAWLPCGSIISGHLRALSTTIPLSTEKESTGRPAMFHARIFTGLPSVAFKENDSEHGIFLTLHCSTQPDIQSYKQTTQVTISLTKSVGKRPNVFQIWM